LSALPPGSTGRVAGVTRDLMGRAERLAALGVSPGATVRVLQTFPGIVFECDQTELAVEREVARSILVHVEGSPAAVSSDSPRTMKDTKDHKPRNLSCASFLRLMFRGESCRGAV
jgi:Fe2+ transport system protein FeoA